MTTSEARDSRTSTDFSIDRILAVDDRRRCAVGALASVRDREVTRKRRARHDSDRDHANAPRDKIAETRRGREGRQNDVDRHVAGRRHQDVSGGNDASATGRSGADESAVRKTDLTWLQYTRYRPPKLPRKSAVEKRAKRRTGDHPRIPFSSSQLRVLEDRYERNAYLSRNDVVEMSAALRLPQSKVR